MTSDLTTVPLAAISVRSKQVISMLLNITKILPCENGLPRDWRGLAHLLEFNGEVYMSVASNSNPTMYMLSLLEQNQKHITIKDFQTMMEQLDRWDVIDDTVTIFENDAAKYFEQKERAQVSADKIEQTIDQEVLTLGDIHRLSQGLGTQHYDAFLLYADEDANFAYEVVQKLETEYKLKLCLKDRDLVGGVTFEHEAIMKLIYDRCNRLLVIISPSFLESSTNKFLLNYTQALSIDKRQRKIIPFLYKKCELPSQLRYIFTLDYSHKELYDFWGRLHDSIRAPNSGIISTTQKVTEVTNILSDKPNNILENQEASKETSKYSQKSQKAQVSKNVNVMEKNINQQKTTTETINVSKALNSGNKTSKTLLQWVKGTAKHKTMQSNQHTMQSDQSTTELVENLPSLSNLDSLDLSATDIHKKKKKKRKLFDKFTKKGQMKNLL